MTQEHVMWFRLYAEAVDDEKLRLLAGDVCPRWAPGEPVELCVEYDPESEAARQEAIMFHSERYDVFEHWQSMVELLLAGRRK
jgi:hypothetical protein